MQRVIHKNLLRAGSGLIGVHSVSFLSIPSSEALWPIIPGTFGRIEYRCDEASQPRLFSCLSTPIVYNSEQHDLPLHRTKRAGNKADLPQRVFAAQRMWDGDAGAGFVAGGRGLARR